jgi:hypothetical protein
MTYVMPILDLLPISTLDPCPRDKELARHGLITIEPKETYFSPMGIVKKAIENDGLGRSHTTYSHALKNSEIYRNWQKTMPFLKDVPNISDFRNQNKHKNDRWTANDEVLQFGGLLSKGQILFRGGTFNRTELLIDDGPISTSLHPSVARWHAVEVKGQVAILRIAEDVSIRAFAYKITGNQRHKGEYEVLVQSGLRLRQYDQCVVGKIEVRAYDVVPANA